MQFLFLSVTQTVPLLFYNLPSLTNTFFPTGQYFLSLSLFYPSCGFMPLSGPTLENKDSSGSVCSFKDGVVFIWEWALWSFIPG